jgi:hypothetical protein
MSLRETHHQQEHDDCPICRQRIEAAEQREKALRTFLADYALRYHGVALYIGHGRTFEECQAGICVQARALLAPPPKCPRCGEPADGLFNGTICGSCDWPEPFPPAEPEGGKEK